MKGRRILLVGSLILVALGTKAQQPTVDSTLLVPEFYFPKPYSIADSIFDMKCYDRQNRIVTNWASFTEVRFVSVFRSYTDHKHTYKDKDGKEQPLPVSAIVVRYDRLGTGYWMKVDYATKQYTKLTEFRDEIVKSDTMPAGQGRRLLYHYYRVRE